MKGTQHGKCERHTAWQMRQAHCVVNVKGTLHDKWQKNERRMAKGRKTEGKLTKFRMTEGRMTEGRNSAGRK